MANKKEQAGVYLPDDLGKNQKTEGKRPSKIKRWLKIFAILLLLLVLIIGGFFLGIYLRIFDTNTINEKMELYKYPIIGDYFVKPTDEEKDKTADKATTPDAPDSKKVGNKIEDAKLDPNKLTDPSKPVVLTKEQVEKQMKLQQAEEKKRISKLARLYGQMKAPEAVAIMDDLDDDMTIAILQKMDEGQTAKVLAAFDPEKSARLTKIMYNGKPPVMQVP